MTTFKPRMIKFAGQTFILDPDRAVHWPEQQTLIVADVHFGKGALFRERGLPVPSGTTASDLCRLDQLVARSQPKRLLILGDCFHGKLFDPSSMYKQLAGWRRKRPELAVHLVRGNHDRSAGDVSSELDIVVHERPLTECGIVFAHEPIDADLPVMCGHIHPAASLRDFDGHAMRLPCFVVEDRLMILPAFGGFTGSATVCESPCRRLFVAGLGRVVPVSGSDQSTAVTH